ncbi:hypothetical protein MANY_42110 [Mycolicibacterium anyangense]|uniref:Uncharacterized protein n=1 Tax=Mycolicibacterium anyangense TaxID=1431246 RepID=A0A6N4WFK0_9MYCO|nr:hypothetical protein [Mycolicibacterium anyangense]BBZ78874.1 hypothetical protein MANY_42110 [Mycolicibacterium anyangense]
MSAVNRDPGRPGGRTIPAWLVTLVVLVLGPALASSGVAGADDDPWGESPAPVPLPVVVPVADNWQPQFPFPFDQSRQYVTPADITAEGEMCQWFNQQYRVLKLQIERLNNTIIRNNGDFNAGAVPGDLQIVLGNIDQSLDYLAPRAQALTQSYDHAGDMYFPIYQGDAFYGLWQQLSNVSNGLKAHQPTWFSGPSFLRAQHWGSKINRSDVCGQT